MRINSAKSLTSKTEDFPEWLNTLIFPLVITLPQKKIYTPLGYVLNDNSFVSNKSLSKSRPKSVKNVHNVLARILLIGILINPACR